MQLGEVTVCGGGLGLWGLAGLAEDVEVELFIESGQLALVGGGERLVGEIHEDAVVSDGVVDESGLELCGHEAGVSGGGELVVETGEQLVVRGIVEDEAAADPRAEWQELRRAEAIGEARVAGEDDAEELSGVEVFAGEDAQLVEDGSGGLLRFVDDQHGPGEGLGDVVVPASAQGLEAGPAIVDGEGDAEEVSELSIEVAGPALRMLDGADHDMGDGAKSVGEQPQSDGLAGAGVAGEHGEAAVGDAELDAAEEGVDGRRSVEGCYGSVRAEEGNCR